MLVVPELPEGAPRRRVRGQDHGLDVALDQTLIQLCEGALLDARPVSLRAAGAQREPHRRHDARLDGHPPLRRRGPARRHHRPDLRAGRPGQSFGAFVPRGITMRLFGDANDYVGKGLSGGRIVVRPAPEATLRGRGQRASPATSSATAPPAARSSCAAGSGSGSASATPARWPSSRAWATTRCEYMTGGRAVILGATGRNVAAGMSGGIGYVLDLARHRVNGEMVDVEPLDGESAAVAARRPRSATRDDTELAGGARAAGRLGPLVRAVQRDHAAGLPRGRLEARAGRRGRRVRRRLEL